MCITAMEPEFTQPSKLLQIRKLKSLIKSSDWFMWGRAENACVSRTAYFKLVISRLFEANMASEVSCQFILIQISYYICICTFEAA